MDMLLKIGLSTLIATLFISVVCAAFAIPQAKGPFDKPYVYILMPPFGMGVCLCCIGMAELLWRVR